MSTRIFAGMVQFINDGVFTEGAMEATDMVMRCLALCLDAPEREFRSDANTVSHCGFEKDRWGLWLEFKRRDDGSLFIELWEPGG